MSEQSRFSTISDVERYLEKIPRFSREGARAVRYALEPMERFCRAMGDPQKRFRTVHVGGTNGKGTTCQMLASLWQQAGYRTGLYTSPHLSRFNERIRINTEPIPDQAMLEFFRLYEKELEEIPLTYFEMATCLAFWYLEKEKCDICVIETGLGGRLDATNLIDPLVSIITSVSIDHADLLGETIPEIAREKAGIIKPERPVVTGDLPPEAMEEVRWKAALEGSRIFPAMECRPIWKTEEVLLTDPATRKTIRLGTEGRKKVDRINMAIAWRVVLLTRDELPVTEREFIEGVERLDERFPDHAHFQRLLSGREWYFDGAHNAEALQTLQEQVSGRPEPVIILSVMKDKAVPEFLENFRSYQTVYYIDTGTERSAECHQIRSMIPQVTCLPNDTLAIERVLEGLKTELVIFTGSFYFYPQVKKWMASQATF